ncbi:MAG TPA: S8 family serine peptidase [Puia sp.]|uniref:S8 family serine peptidase n=1 Tax=Puia sp. TaxID=2045100 RepID=UPI002C88F57E|nr:S8 family serine peptidase [Puia sp.]HVU94432.1 S8 family serine peptidase [Puia sp.]
MPQPQRILPAIGPHFPVKSVDDFIILPTGLRLDADARYTGKGITIAIIDSGFYPHPDLTALHNRILAHVDCRSGKADLTTLTTPASKHAWHGTMTSVVCAGDGYCSKGLYKGIASDAGLVLISVQDEAGRITADSIACALRWIQVNHAQYGIRVVNLSIGSDESRSYKEDEVDQLAEALISAGLTVVAAIGNEEHGAIHSPANSPNVIAVGGADDANRLDAEVIQAYHSAYGRTADNLHKPELVAPAIWIAAPILPGSPEQQEARDLFDALLTATDHHREDIVRRIRAGRFISRDYMHVDGTSFAAPIVTAVIAQLLEAKPALTPFHIREILLGTARRLSGIPAERQGFGIINPRKALLRVLKKQHFGPGQASPVIDTHRNLLAFHFEHDSAHQVSLAGSFNDWTKDALLLQPGGNGRWMIEIPMLPAGRHTYKFIVDDSLWTEDVGNPFRTPDDFGGFNNFFTIGQNQ